MLDENHSLPPELDWEQMESGILNKMEALQPSVKTVGDTSRNRKLTVGASFILLLLFIPFICHRANLNKVQNTPIVSQNSSDKKTSAPQNSATANTSISELATSDDESSNNDADLIKDKINKFNSNPLYPTINNVEEKYAHAKNELFNSTELVNSKEPNKQLNPKINIDENIAPLVSYNNNNIARIESIPAFLPARKVFLKTKATVLLLPYNDSVFTLKSQEIPSRLVQGVKQIIFLSGLSMSGMGYGNNKPERHSFEKNIPSFSVQINYVQPLKNNFSFLVGLQYQQFENRLNKRESLDDHIITLADTILQVQNNSLTGQQNIVRGDAEVTVTAERNIRHYNKTQIYQIPLAVGKKWSFQKWEANIFIGGAFNIYTQNKGRTLYQNEIYDYDGASTGFMNNQWKINAMASGRLTYKINQSIGITSGLQFQKSISDWSREEDVVMRPQLINMELGMNYFF